MINSMKKVPSISNYRVSSDIDCINYEKLSNEESFKINCEKRAEYWFPGLDPYCINCSINGLEKELIKTEDEIKNYEIRKNKYSPSMDLLNERKDYLNLYLKDLKKRRNVE